MLCTAEFVAGFSVLSGIRFRTGIWVVILMMALFTPLTLVLALTNPVSDCGCFGDAVHLTNWQTFGKNVIILVFAIFLFARRNSWREYTGRVPGILILLAAGSMLVLFSAFNLRYLPVIDFLPYKKGTVIADKMIIPEGAPVDEYSSTFIYEKDGVQKEFTLENYPADDTTWKFVDTRTTLLKRGYTPEIHDFSIKTTGNTDLTESILASDNYTLLMIAKRISETDPKRLREALTISSFCRQNGKLLAVTLLNEEGKSRIRIYTLAFPPDSLKEGFAAAASDRRLLKYAIIVLVCFLILAGIHLFVRRKNKQSETISTNTVESSKAVHQSPAPRGEICHVNFFGDFQIVNSAGTDITRKFTPLLKELFLLIWFNSIRNDMGISNEKITDILWHGFSESSANNNKAVNIAKLRAILTKELWCDLSYKETGYWKIDYKCRNVINDYYEFIRITSSKQELSKPDVLRLIEFAIKGPLLKDLKYKWLDEFRVAVSNEMIARLVRYVRTLVIKDNPEHVIRVADAILNYDGVNEEAMENKCKSLISLGRHSVAKEVYDHYAGEYKALYGEAYSKSFSTIANQPS